MKIQEVDKELLTVEKEFWDNGGTCCTSCGIPGFHELSLKQEYRELHAARIKAKIERMKQVPIENSYKPEELYSLL